MLHRLPGQHPPAATPRRSADAADVALLSRIVGRDLDAFECLYRNYHPRLERFLGLMAPTRTIVEEALNDTMLVVWQRAHTFNGTCKVSTWIFGIAYRLALKALRTQGDWADTVQPDELVSDGPGPEQEVSLRESRTSLVGALAALSAEQRSVLVLAYFHDLPYAEIARIVECPVDTVKTRVFHGRRRLRVLLQGGVGTER